VARPAQARALAPLSDGVVVGSALVQLHAAEGVSAVGPFVRALREALRRS
jgi:tryptophan synthase alpha subunit